MQHTTLDYRRPHVQTLEWRRDYSRPDWEAALSTAEGHEILLRRSAADGVVLAQHRDERWSLRDARTDVYVHRPGEAQAVATLRRRWLAPDEITFADGRLVHIAPARSFEVTRTQRVSFVEGPEPLLLMRKLFWPIRGNRIRMDTTDAGMAFPGRTILAVLGFHKIVVRDMISG